MKKVSKKTCLASLIFFLTLWFGKSANAQNIQSDDSVQNAVEKVVKPGLMDADTARLKSGDAKKTAVKFSDFNNSLYCELQGFSYISAGNVTMAWSPMLILKPVVFFGNFSGGVTTTQMVQNIITDGAMERIMHDLYGHVEMRVGKDCQLFSNFGYQSLLNYAGIFSQNMSLSNFFTGAIKGHSGDYFPMAVIGGMRSKNFAVSAGWAKMQGPKWQFGDNGNLVVVGEVFLNKVNIGTLLIANKDKCMGDLQVIYKPNENNSVFFEAIHIGDSGMYMRAIYAFTAGDVTYFVGAHNVCNGAIGGVYAGFRLPSGLYSEVGYGKGDIMNGTNGKSCVQFQIGFKTSLGCLIRNCLCK